MEKFDAVILGGGPGGHACALWLARHGLRAAMVERENPGGTCLNWGCIPTKALIQNTDVADTLAGAATYGFASAPSPAKDAYAAAHSRSREVVRGLRRGMESQLKHHGVALIRDTGRIGGPGSVATENHGVLYAENIVIATGSRPRIPPHFSPDMPGVLTAREALSLTELPERACIIGAGAIGLEFAHIWSGYGCEVTVIELQDAILPGWDRQVAAAVRAAMEKRGVHFITGTQVAGAARAPGGLRLTLSGGELLSCGAVLLAAGVVPHGEDIGLAGAGVPLENGWIKVDDAMRTGVRGIYAIGDVTGILPLAHTASAQGAAAADAIAGMHGPPINYSQIPKCVYCAPEAAAVGLTGEQCAALGLECKTGIAPFSANGMAAAQAAASGFIKVIAEAATGRILGVHMVGSHVTELISQCVILMGLEATPDEVGRMVFPHPSLSEALWEACRAAI